MAGVELSGVTRRYGAYVAAQDVNFSVGDGEFVALVGPSGCGKSTLLRMIAGLDWPDAGTIRIGGREVAALDAADRDVAMVFQNYALYPHLTIRENLATPLAMRRLRAWERMPLLWRLSAASRQRRTQIDADVTAAADALGIGALLERKPAALSGGQRQRVALGRAIVRQPAVFLYDEPLSNLDAELRASMRSEIVELHRRLGVATIYVTHDQVEAMTMADRIAVMRAGRILQFGTPAELYTQPVSLDVARTLGTPGIGMLSATVRGESGGLATAGGCVLPLAVRAAEGATVTVGLRAEHLVLTSIGHHGALPARVLHVECLGADTLVHVGLFGQPYRQQHGQPRVVGQLTEPRDTQGRQHTQRDSSETQPRLIVRVARGLSDFTALPRAGDAVGVLADLPRALVFDETGQRLMHDVIVSGAAARPVAAHG